MKRGCLFLVGLWVGLGFAYYYLLLQSGNASDNIWAAVGYSLSVVLVVAQLQGLLLALKQYSASRRSPQQWRDGDFVAVSGRLQCLKQPIVAPFSERPVCLVEYEMKPRSSDDSQTGAAEFSGMIMAPCAIHTERGTTRIIGFPLMAQVAEEDFTSDIGYDRAAQYLITADIKQKSKNVLKLLSDLTTVLSDDDGEVKVDFGDPSILTEDYSDLVDVVQNDEDFDDEEDFEVEQRRASSLYQSPEEMSPADARRIGIKRHLARRGLRLVETAIPNGAEVAVFGTYRAAQQSIDIGSGLEKIHHQLHLGTAQKIINKAFYTSVVGLVVTLAICGTANWYLAKSLGIDLNKVLTQFGLAV